MNLFIGGRFPLSSKQAARPVILPGKAQGIGRNLDRRFGCARYELHCSDSLNVLSPEQDAWAALTVAPWK